MGFFSFINRFNALFFNHIPNFAVFVSEEGCTIAVDVPGHSKDALSIIARDNRIKLTTIPGTISRETFRIDASWTDHDKELDMNQLTAEWKHYVLYIKAPYLPGKQPNFVKIQ